ncbi:hypothetical protein [Streptomyces sp. NPDC058202]|uniref:hypothetical protein n=1 Tax=Streptomyces sp. NPDC058202 TaxID=3346380 RepID=UPI0036EDD160
MVDTLRTMNREAGLQGIDRFAQSPLTGGPSTAGAQDGEDARVSDRTSHQEPGVSRTSDVSLVFAHTVTVSAVVSALAGAGWSLEEPLGLSYVVNHDDKFDWQATSVDRADEILSLLDAPENHVFDVAICVYHPGAETGGQLLFLPGRSRCYFLPTIDRRSLPGAPGLTDIAWYLNALIPALLPVGLLSYKARDLAD